MAGTQPRGRTDTTILTYPPTARVNSSACHAQFLAGYPALFALNVRSSVQFPWLESGENPRRTRLVTIRQSGYWAALVIVQADVDLRSLSAVGGSESHMRTATTEKPYRACSV